MKNTLALVLLLAVCVGSPHMMAQSGLTVIDFPPTPTTLGDLFANVDLVVFARITKVGALEVRANGDHPRRFQDVKVLEVLKADPKNSSATQIVVRQSGGTFRSATGEMAYTYPTRLLEANELAFLFLKRVPGQANQYDIAYGKDGLVHAEMSDVAIDLPGGLKKMPEFASRQAITTAQLLAELRAKRNQVRP